MLPQMSIYTLASNLINMKEIYAKGSSDTETVSTRNHLLSLGAFSIKILITLFVVKTEFP